MMVSIAVRVLIFVVIVYTGLAAIIFFQQNKFIFPAPQDTFNPPAGFEAVTLETADGLLLAAHWRAPADGMATLVHFHGNSGTLAGAARENAVLAEQGYGVLLVEYRGYGGNPGKPSESGFREDGRAALAFVAAQGVASERTIIKGHSIGTGTAVTLAGEYDAAALILVAPFTSIPDLLAQKMPIFPMRALVSQSFDNKRKLPNLALPVLIQHGDNDAVVPMAHGRALSEAGGEVTFEIFGGAGHDLTVDPKVQAAQDQWLQTLSL